MDRILALLAMALGVVANPRQATSSCPVDMVSVPGKPLVCIDRYPWPNKQGERPWTALSGIAEQRDIEIGYVKDVETLCAMAGKRPCRRSEWVSSCKGPGGSRYPWGDTLPAYVPGMGKQLPCNGDKVYVATKSERLLYLRDKRELARLDQTEPLGSRPGCVSASGMADAIGQVEQWVQCGKKGKYGWCLVGGHWAKPKACDDEIGSHNPQWHYFTTGGRCCLDLKPTK